MPADISPWTESFRVQSYEVTPSERASLQSLCNYMQEAAGNSARELGFSMEELLERGQAWVLARLRMEIDRYPRWKDTVQVETWPSGLDRLYATREFILHDDEGPFARASSAWLVIDTERRRPTRPPAVLREVDVPDRPAPLTLSLDSIPAPETTEREQRFRVRFSDLDLNRHVNNVRYVEWAVEAVPERVLTHYQPTGLDIQFRAETTFGDTILTQAQQLDGGDTLTYRHQVSRAEDGRTAARATTQWTLA